jgi:two-component system response regulator GlrR
MIAGAMVLCEKSIITEQDLAFCQHVNQQQETYQQAKKNVVNEFEKRYIQSLLALHQGNISKAASTAQKNRRAFWEIIRKHDIDVQKFRAPEPQGK